MYKTKIQELVKELLGEDEEDEQNQYLEDTMQPTEMNAIEYLERVEEINEQVEWFLPIAAIFSESYIIRKCISKGLRGQIRIEFVAKEGHKLAKIDDCLKKLKGCLKVVEVQREENEQIKTAKERKKQNGWQ